jgi:hypothetical protein
MKLDKLIMFLVLLCFVFAFGGCQQKEAPPLKIVKVGPAPIKAGQDFNVQPDGTSAIWLETENATKTTVVVWGETELRSAFGSPNSVTASVPKELYSKPGQFQISLLDKKTGAKSNSIVFAVGE